ncbi:MAG: dihydroorotate dehydrogenase-like protein [Chlorobiaceae bacterium]|jgi:dihydroorotate dehydrogenase (fumarate)|nr:dihydroorotate dehydrogenase-like protein [Chlorobiaceae bacterium]
MADISTTWMGLKLRNPVIVASSGLTGTLENVKAAAAHGAGAVVLKSLFEEQIQLESGSSESGNAQDYYYAQAEDYIREYTRGNALSAYLDLIRQCKDAVDIPVIASINCVTHGEWTAFASEIERAGADGLEINIFVLPSDPGKSCSDNERVYVDVLDTVSKAVRIPVAAKISSYFSGLASEAVKLSATGIGSLVLFNRFFSPDFDIETFDVTASGVFSSPTDLYHSLRWIAILSGRVQCDLAASTGVHDGSALIKQLLAGARAVEIASVLYRKGLGEIGIMLEELEQYMDRHMFFSLDELVGKMSMARADNPAVYERVQFMKYFGGIH